MSLLDNAGKELGFGPTDNSFPKVYPTLPTSFSGKAFGSDGILVEVDTKRQVTTVYSGLQVIWSGHRLPNDGVRFGRSPESPVYGIPTPDFPIGTNLTFQITRETGSVAVTDVAHRLIETVPTNTLHFTVLSDDEKFRKSIQNWVLFSPHVATTQVELEAPGEIITDYRTATGAWAGKALVHAIADFPNKPWNFRHQKYLHFWTTNYNEAGKEAGTFDYGDRPLGQD